MLNKCSCGCDDIRLCVISRISRDGKTRIEKFSHYCQKCGKESHQCSVEYPVDMTVREYLPWRQTVINASESSWNSQEHGNEKKTECTRNLKRFFKEIVERKNKFLKSLNFGSKKGGAENE